MTTENFYTLGLDIGMASVGAALLGPDRIVGLFVRTFDKAEQPKDGESLNAVRRGARSVRKRLRRRAHRLLRLARLLKRHGLLSSATPPQTTISPWQLRSEALDRRLSGPELAAALYHLIKHRGFHSSRKSELKDDEKVGQMLAGVSQNRALLADSDCRTMGELAHRHEAFRNAKRNKAGAYQRTFSREDLREELQKIFAAQQDMAQHDGQPLLATPALAQAVATLLMARRPALSGAALLEMVGKCPFETKLYRAPKASFRAEQFVWFTRLNNLRLVGHGTRRELSQAERTQLLNLPFVQSKLTYKQVRKLLGLAEAERFVGLHYRPDGKNPEDATLFEAKAFHLMRKIVEQAGEAEHWPKRAQDADWLDDLAYALTCLKEDQESRAWLTERGYSPALIEAALDQSFSDFIRLSKAALIKILPFMQAGRRYDEAVIDAGYAHHSKLTVPGMKQRILPVISKQDFPNPVVRRALNQARKLVNAIIREYGAPQAVHIELARDLAKPFDERKKIEKAQLEFQKEKKDAVDYFIDKAGHLPRGKDLQKMRLYREQDGQSAYSGAPIDLNRMLHDSEYSEIDHILPYSRSWDDSQNNKVLVLKTENQQKGNRTPYEYLDGANDSARWRQFCAWVGANKKIRQAKRQRLLRVHLGKDEKQDFLERNLNDTRYICKTFKNLLETHLQLASSTPTQPDTWRALVLSGQLTAYLRNRWGLLKVRQDGDLHHALDAAVVAACSYRMVQLMATWARSRELEALANSYPDPETGEIVYPHKGRDPFPMPWPHFALELKAWLSTNPAHALQSLPQAKAPANLAALRVSRAPLRRSGGEAHQETIRSKHAPQGKSAVKTPLTSLKLKDLENIVGYGDARNAELIAVIEERLHAHKDDGRKAFAEPLYKPSAPDKVAPQIRSVKLLSTQLSGVDVRQGIANNGSMVRVDIFSKKGQYFAIPLYVAHRVAKQLPMKAVLANKPETAWPELDDSYQFCFSLHPNDWVCVRFGEGKPVKEGYFAGLDRSTGAISLWTHDRNQTVGDKGLLRSIGIKTVAALEKYHVDVLGRLYRARPETRQPMWGTAAAGAPIPGKRANRQRKE